MQGLKTLVCVLEVELLSAEDEFSWKKDKLSFLQEQLVRPQLQACTVDKPHDMNIDIIKIRN